MKNIPVLLMGCGGVGRHLLQHIIACRTLHAKQGIHLRVVGVCDSKCLVVAPDVFTTELGDGFLSEVLRIKSGSSSSLTTLSGYGECQVFAGPDLTKKVIDTAALLGKPTVGAATGLALVDCSASSETIGILNRAVDFGCCVVLANKKPLTSELEEFDKLFSNPRRIRHESTVGAGLPVIASLNRVLASGDPVHRIIGSLSGTLGYVMTEVEDGKPFSQVVKSAKALGYTEPGLITNFNSFIYSYSYSAIIIIAYPRDDLSGMDVARKALILARLLGQRINMESIKIESLYPEEMGPGVMSVEDFLVSGVSLLDKDIQERVHKASLNGKVLRYVCVIEGSRCEVGIQELPKNSALGRLKGSDNVLEIYSRCYTQQPLVIQGAGAGNDTTACGVLADILDLQDLFP